MTDQRPLRVHFLYLTDTVASERLYSSELRAALSQQGVRFVDDWRAADVVHLFEVNVLTADALSAFRFPTLVRIIRSDTPLVVSTDDLYFTGDPSLTARPRLYPVNHHLQRWLFRRCDAVVAISESVRSRLAPLLPSTPVHVVHHGVAGRYFAETQLAEEPYVLHVSLASKRKNPDAVAAVAEQFDGRVVVAGGGWDEHVDADRPGVEIPGYVPEEELPGLYAAASVFYFPTRHEGFGLPLLEAMAARTAVVSTDVYSVPEVTGGAAVLHPPDDIDAHLDSIRALVDDDGRRRELGQCGRERAQEFTWEQTATETAAVYEAVLNGS